METVKTILDAYRMTLPDGNYETGEIFCEKIRGSNMALDYLMEAIEGDRSPKSIMATATKIGMYIPVGVRYGLNSYKFFIDNVRHYENVFQNMNSVLDMRSIMSSADPVKSLSFFADAKIFDVTGNNDCLMIYMDRMEMLSHVVREINVGGNFILKSNDPRMYQKGRVITFDYYGARETLDVSTVLTRIDEKHNVIWVDDTRSQACSTLCVGRLADSISVNITRWENEMSKPIIPSNLVFLLHTIRKLQSQVLKIMESVQDTTNVSI
jgi:hypothetical protein